MGRAVYYIFRSNAIIFIDLSIFPAYISRLSHSFISLHNIMSMSQTEFDNCPRCRVGRMMASTIGGAALSNDSQTGKETSFGRDYKCDNCGFPDGGHQNILGVNEDIRVGGG